MNGTILFGTGAICLTIATGIMVDDQKEILNPAVKPAGLEAHDTHAAASLLGQFRTNASSWMYLRADLYLHNGVLMRPLSDLEEKTGKKGVGNSDSDHGKLHDDSKIVTVVPSAKDDFRGIFGDVERATSAYKDMKNHAHNSPTQSMALFRLMTWVDPQFTKGWTVGATILAWDKKPGSAKLAYDYLREGLDANPQSIDIKTNLAEWYVRYDRQFAKAMPLLKEAIQTSIGNLDRLSDEEMEATRQSLIWLYISQKETGERVERLQTTNLAIKLFPKDELFQKYFQEARWSNEAPQVVPIQKWFKGKEN